MNITTSSRSTASSSRRPNSAPAEAADSTGVEMRIVTLEEHFALPSFRDRVAGSRQTSVGDDPTVPATVRMSAEKIVDLGAGRLADMDRSGISVQVLSKAGNHFGPSADML